MNGSLAHINWHGSISVKQYNIKSDVALKYKQIPTVTYSNCAALK